MGIAPATLRALPAVGAAIALGLASVLPAPAQEPSLPRVLARATEYVEALHAQLSGVVMEERYRQRASSPGFGRLGADSYERVTLRSDYLLVRPEGSERYFGFRDVFEANGSRVRDREERLTQLFLGGTLTEDRQVQGILTDSARYDTGRRCREAAQVRQLALALRGFGLAHGAVRQGTLFHLEPAAAAARSGTAAPGPVPEGWSTTGGSTIDRSGA